MNTSALPQLCIISDLWGNGKADWYPHYESHLKAYYQVHFLDACELGQIDTTNYSEQALHAQFVAGGIDQAVQQLLDAGKVYDVVLGLSVGGVIAWRAICQGLKTQHLVAVSATRLRKEHQHPTCHISLHFGELDPHQPDSKWHSRHRLSSTLWPGKGHNMYQEADFAAKVCAEITGFKVDKV